MKSPQKSCKHIWYFSVRFLFPGTEEPSGLQSMGLQSQTWLKRLSSSSSKLNTVKTAKPWGSCKGTQEKETGLGWSPRWRGRRGETRVAEFCSGSLVAGWPSMTGAGVSAGDSAVLSFHASWFRGPADYFPGSVEVLCSPRRGSQIG